MNKKSNLIGIVADLHLGVRNNNRVFATFQRKYILDMLEYYHSINVTSLIQLGDYVDQRKSISGELIHWLSNTFIPKLAEYGMTYYQLAGNHSQCLLNSNEITFDQLLEDLSVVYGNSCVRAITSPTDICIEGLDVCCIPWINKSTHDLTVAHIEKSNADICVAHLEVAGVYLLKGSVTKTGHIDSNCFKKFEQVISGHIHTSSSVGNLFFAGSPYSLNWGEWEEPAENGIYTLDTLTQKLEFIPNTPDQSMFLELEYNYTNIASQKLGKKYLDVSYLEGELHLKDKIVRINITDRSNTSHFKKFMEALRCCDMVNYNTIDLTKNIELEAEEVTAEAFKLDTLGILLNNVEDIESEDENFRYEEISNKLESVYNICQDENNLI